MAARIETALAERGVFVGESGTGTGKTYAYLVPERGLIEGPG
jgi:Rad3-related DNA helicase